ncbi:MAG: hypothetical protein ACYTDY_16040 [Planctomycetota bacterium]|jgi:hypothetical protein
MRKVTIPLGCILALGLLVSPARADLHKDEQLGFSVVSPKKWKSMPLAGRDWTVARFESNRQYEWQDKEHWTYHRPYMEVIVLPLELIKQKGAVVEKTKKGIKVKRDIPWKNMREYLDKTCRNIGGFYFASEKEAKVNGMKVMQYEIVVDKLVRGKRKVLGWEYHTEDALWCFFAEILLKEEKKLKPLVLNSFKTFKTFARKGRLPHTGRTGEDIVVKKESDDEELTDEELKLRRQEAFARALARIKETLPKDWKVMESKNFVAVTHTDAKYTKKLLVHAEALKKWLEKNLGYVGGGYTGKIIIRIFANSSEHSSFGSSGGWWRDAPEVTTYKDKQGWSDWAMETLNSQIYRKWLRDKNDELLGRMPSWLEWGLPDFVQELRSKGSKMEFKPDTWDSVQMGYARRDGKLIQAKEFFTVESKDLFQQWQSRQQSAYFVRFLLAGSASRSGKYKNILSDYIKNLIFVLEEARDKQDKAPKEKPKEPESEEEENEMYKKRQESWRKRERQILDSLLKRTFSDWTDTDWLKLNQLYWKDLK